MRVIFDSAQRELCRKESRLEAALSYTPANLTHWTTHFVAFACLCKIKPALRLAVAGDRKAIITAQVSAAMSTELRCLTEDATYHCDLIDSSEFWNGLEQVCGDIEPICYGTNLSQKDSTRADQVLIMLGGIYLHFSEHPEPGVAEQMKKRL